MDDMGDDPPEQVLPSLPRAGHHGKARELLERSEARFRVSAARLRASDMAGPARRAEQFADWIRLDLDHPRAARLLRGMLGEPRAVPAPAALLDGILDFGLELLRADRGNVQITDPATGALAIVAQRGFDAEFVEYFAVVTDDGSACGRAASRGAQVVIADVTTDPGFARHRDIAWASGFRAVQSTPLTDRSGRLVGVLSTHYPRPITPRACGCRKFTRPGDIRDPRSQRDRAAEPGTDPDP